MIIATIKQAKLVSGVVTAGNSKVHGSTFSVDPTQCKVGSKLAKIKGSTCSKCYAIKLSRVYPTALKSWSDNLAIFNTHKKVDTLDHWAKGIAKQITQHSQRKAKKGIDGARYHRWFAAGDLSCIDMLRAIVKVAEQTPDINHWLPTREAGIIRQYKNMLGTIPNNLIIRVSSAMVNASPNKQFKNTSTVHGKTDNKIGAFSCPAYDNEGSCGSCISCWDKKVSNVSYKQH